MNPLYQLELVARQVESLGDYALARQITRTVKTARLVMGASDEVALDSWTEFETWFLKNRAQGLEFVFEDKYGSDSAESEAVKQLLEGYDLMERKLHELYVMLRGDAEAEPAPVEEPSEEAPAEEAPAEEPAEETSEEPEAESETSEVASDLAESMAALDTGTEEQAETTEAESGEVSEEGAAEEATPEEATEETSEEETQGKEASSKTPEFKMITRIQKLMKRAGVSVSTVMFRGSGSYRIVCADAESGDSAEALFQSTGWQHARVDHPVKVMLDVTPGR